jgi:glycosyltransferase involved in cell wall biosynthesis
MPQDKRSVPGGRILDMEGPMIAAVKRLRLEFEDWLRYHPTVRGSLCRFSLLRGRQPDPNDTQGVARNIVHLCSVLRLAEDATLQRRLNALIVEQVRQLDPGRIDWREFVAEFDDPRVNKSVILKPYVSPREKGVLFVAFEEKWIKLLKPANYRELGERYAVVLSPSFSPPHVLSTYAFPAIFPGPVFTLISHPKDLDYFARMSPNLIAVPLYASSWVNPELFQPLPRQEREYDLLMVANFGKFKRHQAFFRALRSMPPDLRILLIGQNQDGRTAETIRGSARWYGVADRFTLLSNVPYREIPKAYCNARASVVLSKREGSCVAIAESLFADTPAAILQEAGIGSRVFVNDQTGRFLDGKHLARDLTEFVRNADRYQPRQWAQQKITCRHSSRILNDALKQKAQELGHAWTQDIAPMQWAPDPGYLHVEDRARLEAERQDIQQRFGLDIGPPRVQ